MDKNKKTIIQVVVVVAAFAASGFVLYNGYFKDRNNTSAYKASSTVMQQGGAQDMTAAGSLNTPGGTASGASAGGQQILPAGDLDFDKVLTKRKLNFGLVDYPKLTVNSDVGIPESSLIKPPPPVLVNGQLPSGQAPAAGGVK